VGESDFAAFHLVSLSEPIHDLMIHDHPGGSFVLGCDDEVAPILGLPTVRGEIDHEKAKDGGGGVRFVHASIVPEEERKARVRDGFSQLFSRLFRWEKRVR